MEDERFMMGNYTLDVSKYDLSEQDAAVIDNAISLVENNWSLRKLAENTGISKSTLQRDFANKLKYFSYELYQLVQRRYTEHTTYGRG